MFSKECVTCGVKIYRKKKSEAQRKNWKFCSRKCHATYYNKKRKMTDKIKKECPSCGKEYYVFNTKAQVKKKYCSPLCFLGYRNKYNNPMKLISNNKNKIRIKKISKSLTGRSLTKNHLINLSKAICGSKHWNWQGGITPENRKRRSGNMLYKLWRNSVFKRDKYICQDCGIKSGNGFAVILNAHHKEKWSKNKILRYKINNGITLCQRCHKKRHFSYNGSSNNPKTLTYLNTVNSFVKK
jgi:endogenous inhibitor of DNA gyrase (YacG/DUF329 family)